MKTILIYLLISKFKTMTCNLFAFIVAFLLILAPSSDLTVAVGQETKNILQTGSDSKPGDADFPTKRINPRHDQNVEKVRNGDYDLVLIGNSITENLSNFVPHIKGIISTQAFWDKYFTPRHALNLGYSGYRTENILWNLQNGELEFKRSPKVFMILIGTNNLDDQHYPTIHTAEQVFSGTRAIVNLIHEKHPSSKILVLRIFPCGGPGDIARPGLKGNIYNRSKEAKEATLKAGELTAKLDDGKNIFWLDINKIFLHSDGSINADLMPDLVHPMLAGNEAWANAVIPVIDRLMDGKPPEKGTINASVDNQKVDKNVLPDEDGYDLWLRYRQICEKEKKTEYSRLLKHICLKGEGTTMQMVRNELDVALYGMLGSAPSYTTNIEAEGTLIAGKASDIKVAGITIPVTPAEIDNLGPEGYLIRTSVIGGKSCILITAQKETGVLYGIFHLLRLMQTRQDLIRLSIIEKPRIRYRVLDHWDDGDLTDGTEGVYSQDPRSIWWGKELKFPVPAVRYIDYARACASVGINIVIINNVNASPRTFSSEQLTYVRSIADILRPYGIRIGLAPNFGAPLNATHTILRGPGIGNLDTADPTDPAVVQWWKDKADEIYKLIPDFGGFLVKAGSEGMPGPDLYNKTHAEGANMLAKTLAPHGGIVMWRSFIHPRRDLTGKAAIIITPENDKVKCQYDYFKTLDGQFDRNVFLQCKYGPRDFMPREPFHPLLGSMPNTQLSIEFQITQEYTGRDNSLMFWAPLWKEILDSDTYQTKKGDYVAKVIDGSLNNSEVSQIAGVANVSMVRNWTGHHFAQANWYTFGRLAWNHQHSSTEIAEEWVRMTWTNDQQGVRKLVGMLLHSHSVLVDYTAPFGMAHTNEPDHYNPWQNNPRNIEYVSQFVGHTAANLGNDRTTSGTGATAQYKPPVFNLFNDIKTCPENLLLWFHKVPWSYKLSNGKDLWSNLIERYDRGVAGVDEMLRTWDSLKGVIDPERFQEVRGKLLIQQEFARKYRRVWLNNFHDVNGLPLPPSITQE